jgi:hypothetical protein
MPLSAGHNVLWVTVYVPENATQGKYFTELYSANQ